MRHLRTVRAIADTGSLTKAAATLGLAQPALSAQLRRIEKALGGPLFERDHTDARPTLLGELVLQRARVVLPAVSGLQEEAVRFANAWGTMERFRLGGTHGPLLGGLVDRLVTAHPAAPVSTYTSWSVVEIASQLVGGRLDFALIGACGESPPPAKDRLTWQTIGVDPVFVMLPDSHPLAGEQELDLSSLADECWADVPGDGCFADCFVGACARAGFSPVSVYETDTASVVHLVQVGRAVGLCRATFGSGRSGVRSGERTQPGGVRGGGGAQRELHAMARRASTVRRCDVTCHRTSPPLRARCDMSSHFPTSAGTM
ncbi:LysR family transcriptional regulator [Streptomyces sp. BE133]|uniref:LysR family transcriptional regulator n=1 Tax=Streptomyces sp. BE133 TaxID=3002523 RepID=UPI003FA68C6B